MNAVPVKNEPYYYDSEKRKSASHCRLCCLNLPALKKGSILLLKLKDLLQFSYVDFGKILCSEYCSDRLQKK